MSKFSTVIVSLRSGENTSSCFEWIWYSIKIALPNTMVVFSILFVAHFPWVFTERNKAMSWFWIPILHCYRKSWFRNSPIWNRVVDVHRWVAVVTGETRFCCAWGPGSSHCKIYAVTPGAVYPDSPPIITKGFCVGIDFAVCDDAVSLLLSLEPYPLLRWNERGEGMLARRE